MKWCAKTYLHKCSGRDVAFILQRGVHRRANTLSRHKYLVGEQGKSLNSGGERRSAGRRLRVDQCTHITKIDGFRRPNFLTVTQGEMDRWARGRARGRGEPIALSNHALALQSSTWRRLANFSLRFPMYAAARVSSRVRRCQLHRENHICRLVMRKRCKHKQSVL